MERHQANIKPKPRIQPGIGTPLPSPPPSSPSQAYQARLPSQAYHGAAVGLESDVSGGALELVLAVSGRWIFVQHLLTRRWQSGGGFRAGERGCDVDEVDPTTAGMEGWARGWARGCGWAHIHARRRVE